MIGGQIVMDYAEAKKRFMLHLCYFQVEEEGDILSSTKRLREYQSLLEEFGEPDTDDIHEAMDAICEHLIGCLDPAPEWVCDEYDMPDGSTWHDVWRERITDYLMDHSPERYARDLYRVYVKDLAVLGSQSSSKAGFKDWLSAMTWDHKFVERTLNQTLDDLIEIPS
jgi:hypothetical protein